MPVFRDVPLGDYPTGTFEFTSRNAPGGLSLLQITVARCTSADLTIWPNPATRLRIDIFAMHSSSPNAPADSAGRWEQGGGILVDPKSLIELPSSIITVEFSDRVLVRRVLLVATIAGGPLRTFVDVNLE